MARTTSLEAPLLGRETALRHLDEQSRRLICVLGPPGVGKSRLCREWAERRGEEALVVDVSRVTDAGALRALVGRTLCLSMLSAEAEVDEEIGRALAARGGFALVLDDLSCAAAQLHPIETWLARAPELRVITTSRRRPGLSHETLLSLAPLELPSGPELPPATSALRLFIALARRARPDLQENSANLATISRIVTELDGLPLAIELWAARCRLLSLEQVLDRIVSRRARAAPATGAPGRDGHETLDDAIVAAFEALTPESKRDLTRLSVLAGGFEIAAAEAVLQVDLNRAMEVVETFLDQSLLSPEAWLRASDAPRFRMLGPIRDAASLLAPAAGQEAMDRSAAHFARTGILLAQRAIHGEADAARSLSLDRDNLIAAHQHSVAAGHASRAMRAALALGSLLASEGPLSACHDYLTRAVGEARAGERVDGLIALAHGGRAVALLGLGRPQDATAAKHEALSLLPRIEDQALHARISRQIAKVTLAEGDWGEAKKMLEHSLELSTSAGDQHGVALARLALGELSYYRDQLAEGLSHFEAARAIMSAQRALSGLAIASYHAGQVQTELGHNVEAAASLEDAIAGFEQTRNRRDHATALMFVAILEQATGRLEEALASFDKGLYLARTSDLRRCEGELLGYRAGCLLEAAQDREAIHAYTGAIDLLREVGLSAKAFFYAGLAVALARGGDEVGARAALENARHPRERLAEQPFAEHTVTIHAAHVDWLCLSRHGRAAPTDEDRQRALDALALAAPVQSDVRFARRLLEQSLAGDAAGIRAQTPASDNDLRVARSGRWFETRELGRVDLEKRRALRMCASALARMRVEQPGVALSVGEIVQIGWPGERIQPEAARERVYTAITTLRRFGLRDALKRRDDGYLIDPAQPLVLIDDGP